MNIAHRRCSTSQPLYSLLNYSSASYEVSTQQTKTNAVAIERPPLADEVNANFCRLRGVTLSA
jgi:hypothetical protein